MLDTVVMSGDEVCCSVVFGTLVGVFVFSVMLSELLIIELLEFVPESVYVDLQYDEITLASTAGSVCLCGVSSPVVVLGLFVRLS